jgi:hypothetical protein
LKPDQTIRRWLNGVRRRLTGAGADHEPRVLIEGAPRPTFARRPWTLARMLRFVLGFLLTGLALFLFYLGFAAHLARIKPDWRFLETPAAEQSVFAAIAAVTGVTAREDAYRDGWFLAPTRRAQRIAAFQAGAARAAEAGLAVLPVKGDDADFAAARAALRAASANPADAAALTAAADAMARLSRQAKLTAGPDAMRALAAAADASADLAVARLAQASERGRVGPISADAEAAFFESRGEAYAWRVLVQGLAAQSPADGRAALDPEVARAKDAWREAADFQPLLVLNGPAGASFAPNHLAELGLRVALAGAASRQLAAAAQAATPPPDKPRRRGR